MRNPDIIRVSTASLMEGALARHQERMAVRLADPAVRAALARKPNA